MLNSNSRIPIDEIILDDANPRIKHYLDMYTKLNEASMLLALGASSEEEGESTSQGSYQRLKHSIKASGGIIQPIIVKRTGDDRYLCVEGNTRVAIYRQLRGEDKRAGLDEERWKSIPATVRDDMDEQEAHKIRLQVHLVGNRQWDPYSKGKYLNELVKDYKMPMAELVGYCGGSQSDVQQSIEAYRDMEAHYRPVIEDRDGGFDTSRFSAFVELQKPGIKDALFDAGFNEGEFSRWVDDRRLFPLSHVRKLPQILDSPEATDIFLKKGSREAIKALNTPDLDSTLKDSSILQLAQALQEKINLLSFEDAEALADNPNSEEYLDLKDLLSSIAVLLEVGTTPEE